MEEKAMWWWQIGQCAESICCTTKADMVLMSKADF